MCSPSSSYLGGAFAEAFTCFRSRRYDSPFPVAAPSRASLARWASLETAALRMPPSRRPASGNPSPSTSTSLSASHARSVTPSGRVASAQAAARASAARRASRAFLRRAAASATRRTLRSHRRCVASSYGHRSPGVPRLPWARRRPRAGVARPMCVGVPDVFASSWFAYAWAGAHRPSA